jgi:hypothetical protein
MCAACLLGACARSQEEPRVQAPRPDVRLPLEFETIRSRVPAHATLDGLLRGNQLQETLVTQAVDAARGVFDPRRLRADQPYRLVRTLDGLLREFEYEIDADRFLRIISRDRSRPDALEAEVVPYDKQTTAVAIEAQIDADHP